MKKAGNIAQLSTTAALVRRAQLGRSTARSALFRRFVPRLQRMAAARLGRTGIGLFDLEDIVQETLIRAFRHLEGFEPRCDGAFLHYARRILINVIAEQGRHLKRRPAPVKLDTEPAAARPSPVEEAVGSELWEAYQAAVENLPEAQAEGVVLYVECGMEFAEIAEALGSPSVDAARMLVARGLKKLAEKMHVRRG